MASAGAGAEVASCNNRLCSWSWNKHHTKCRNQLQWCKVRATQRNPEIIVTKQLRYRIHRPHQLRQDTVCLCKRFIRLVQIECDILRRLTRCLLTPAKFEEFVAPPSRYGHLSGSQTIADGQSELAWSCRCGQNANFSDLDDASVLANKALRCCKKGGFEFQ